jgi:alkylation response protein AidB-like acyl-CoA dehydrogenase
MDFRLDEAQVALQDTVRRFCADRFPLDRVAEREGRPTDRTVWKELGALGVFGLLLPEPDGGSGLGTVEAAVVFEQLGSHLATGPAVWTLLTAPLVDGAATGDMMVGGVEVSVDAPDPVGRPPGRGDEAVDDPTIETGDDASVADEALVVEHAGEIDALAVLRPDGMFVVSGDDLPPPQELAPLDPLTPVGCYPVLPTGERVGSAEDAARLRLLGTVLSAAMLLGVSDRALDVARSYALEREQFGVPIGSFQAIKHMLADMYVRTGMARSATYAAAAAVDDPHVGDPRRAAAGAKLLASEAALAGSRAAVQVLGGMGFTWEMLPHYLLKRAWVLEHAFGTADEHALALGSAVGDDVRRDAA